MSDTSLESAVARRHRSLGSTLGVLVAVLALGGGGCSAMEGVNVGASVPIGGIGSVGASTTVGRKSAPSQSGAPQPAGDASQDSDSDSDSAPEEEDDGSDVDQ